MLLSNEYIVPTPWNSALKFQTNITFNWSIMTDCIFPTVPSEKKIVVTRTQNWAISQSGATGQYIFYKKYVHPKNETAFYWLENYVGVISKTLFMLATLTGNNLFAILPQILFLVERGLDLPLR